MDDKDTRGRLTLWQGRLERNDSAYSGQLKMMDERERLYAGSDAIHALVHGDKKDKTPHIRNICAEMVESQVSTSIPQPKVTPKRKEDEWRAELIEDMLRNELDRLPMEQINDMMERIVPIQGGGVLLVEWDNMQSTDKTVGELVVSALHPKQVIPQDGVYTSVEDMDYVILKMPQTKAYIRKRYNVCVEDEGEEEPQLRGAGDESTADDIVTQYMAYYRNDNDGIGLYSWVNDTELVDLEDYQSRRLRVCAKCGAIEPIGTDGADMPTLDGSRPPEHEDEDEYGDIYADVQGADEDDTDDDACPYCGAVDAWEEETQDYEEVYEPIVRGDGTVLTQGTQNVFVGYVEGEVDAFGAPIPIMEQQPTLLPYYRPNIFPLVLQKNVSVYGQFLGDSDIDKIASQQNTTNRIEAKIIDKLCASGSVLTLPTDGNIKKSGDDMRVYRGTAADIAMVGVHNLEGDITQDISYLAYIYEEAREIIGITDSYQGRTDSTATSGTAKEFSAAQAAGRLESKRILKESAYAHLFEAMFKFKLSYTDETRPVATNDNLGNPTYTEFSRYDFLDSDGMGGFVWNDDFIFSCDPNSPLATNREAMWQETRLNLQTGAFGDATSTDTLILFWSIMEQQHYPTAGEVKSSLIERQQQEQAQQVMMQQMMMQQAQQAQTMPIGTNTATQQTQPQGANMGAQMA